MMGNLTNDVNMQVSLCEAPPSPAYPLPARPKQWRHRHCQRRSADRPKEAEDALPVGDHGNALLPVRKANKDNVRKILENFITK